jgi:hypothetical protein
VVRRSFDLPEVRESAVLASALLGGRGSRVPAPLAEKAYGLPALQMTVDFFGDSSCCRTDLMPLPKAHAALVPLSRRLLPCSGSHSAPPH